MAQPQAPTTASPPGATQPQAASAASRAAADLAERLDLNPVQVQVLRVEPVQWPDASLGCPQPGQMYAQIITPGYRVTLSAEGMQYEYHTDTLQRALLCPDDR
jgi:hypothetical protein